MCCAVAVLCAVCCQLDPGPSISLESGICNWFGSAVPVFREKRTVLEYIQYTVASIVREAPLRQQIATTEIKRWH